MTGKMEGGEVLGEEEEGSSSDTQRQTQFGTTRKHLTAGLQLRKGSAL